MGNRKKFFHLFLILAAFVIGSLSFWQSGFWLDGRNGVPNVTAMAMVLLLIGQIAGIKAYQNQKKKES